MERPKELDVRLIVENAPAPGHWMWIGKGRLWARLLLYEKTRGVKLDDSHRTKIVVTCDVSSCVRPSHLKLVSTLPSEEMFLLGKSPRDLDQ